MFSGFLRHGLITETHHPSALLYIIYPASRIDDTDDTGDRLYYVIIYSIISSCFDWQMVGEVYKISRAAQLSC